MNLNEYQQKASETAVFPADKALGYLALKLNGEAGEVAELIGKYWRGDDRENEATYGPPALWQMSWNRWSALEKELGDVLWYLSQLAYQLGMDLEEVAEGNLEKLADRKARGVLQGSGSDR